MANIRKTFNFREGVKVDDSVLVVAGQRVGIGSTIPSKVLDIKGDVISSGHLEVSQFKVVGISTFDDVKIGAGITIESSSGIITAVKYFGDGSTLDNLPTSQWTDIDVGLGFTSIYNEGNVGVGTADPRFTFQVGSNPNTVGKFGVGINSLTGDIKSSGIVTASKFVGDGSLLENITSGNINGTVANANIAQYAHVAGIATLAQGLTGTPGINVGYVTATSADYSGVVTATTFVGALNGNASSSTITSSLNPNLNYSIGSTKILSAGIGSFTSVGIGTTNPQTDLQIVNANNSVITLGRSTSATGNNGAIGFGKVTGSFPYSGATSLDILNYGSGNINFYLEAGSIGVNTGDFHWHRRGNFAQLMTLTHQGLLGIGKTNPDHNLHVVGTSTITNNAFFGNNVEIKGDAEVKATLTVGSLNLSSFTGDVVGDLTGNVNATSGLSTFNDLKVTGNSELRGAVGFGTTAREELFDGRPQFPISINPQDNNRILINSSGQIGIRTTEISSSVDVDAIECVAIFGNVGVGTTIPGKASVDFSDAGKIGAAATTNRFMLPPILTNTERSDIYQLQAGALIYNSSDNVLQIYDGSQWQTASPTGISGITAVVQDTSPELGGHLNANSKDIYGVDNLNVTGVSTFANSIHVADSIVHQGDTNTSIDFANNIIRMNTGGTMRMEIQSNQFSIRDNTRLVIQNTSNTGTNYLDFGRPSDFDIGGISYDHSSDRMSFRINTQEKANFNTSGLNVSGIITATSFERSDGTPLAGGVGIKTAGGNVGFGITFLDFRGSAIGEITSPSSGISTINITGGAGGGGGGSVTSVDLSSSGGTLTATGGPITGSGTLNIDMPNSGVSAGSYTNADITVDAQGRITSASSGSSGGTTKIATIKDVKPNGNNGGSVSSINTWLVRDLNTVSDPNSLGITSTSNGVFSLPAGTYLIDFGAPGFHVNEFQARLAYSTSPVFATPPGINYVYGSSEFSGWYTTQGNPILSHSSDESRGNTVVSFATTTYFRVEQNNATDANGIPECLGVDANKGNDEVYTQVTIQDLTSSGGSGGSGGGSDPVGTIVAWGGSVANIPSGYQLCDGGAAATTALQAVIGPQNVPDLRSRFIVGAHNVSGAGSWPSVGVGSTGGSANAVLVAHNHGVTPSTVLSTQNIQNPTILSSSGSGTPLDYNVNTSSSTVGKDNTGSTANTQSGTNQNLPPYYALCYIIKHTASSGSGGGSGDITAVTAGIGLTGGGTSGDVTLDLADTSVSAGSYTNANITVDAQGRITSASSGSSSGGGTVSSGNFTAQAGIPATIQSYAYGSAELVFEYTVFVKNGSNYQTQKLLVMRDGTTVTSTQYGIMYSNTLLVQLDATISGSNLLLRATPESGVTGNTTYRIKREVT